MFMLIASIEQNEKVYLSKKLSANIPAFIAPSLYRQELTDAIANTLKFQLGLSVPITSESDFYQLPEEAMRKINVSIECAKKDVIKESPLLENEEVKEDFYSYLPVPFAGLPKGQGMLRRITNQATIYYFFEDTIISEDGLHFKKPDYLHFEHLIQPTTLPLPITTEVISHFTENNEELYPMMVAYTVDSNRVLESAVQAGASMIPVVGGLLSYVIGAFWPSSGPNYLAIWNGIKSYAEAMMGKLIADALSKYNDAVLTNNLQGIKDNLVDYNSLLLTDPYLSSKITDIKTTVIDKTPFFLGQSSFATTVENPVKHLSFLVGFGTLYLGVLKEDFLMFAFLNPTKNADFQNRLNTFHKNVNDAVALAQKEYQEAKAWRTAQFEVSKLKGLTVDHGGGKHNSETMYIGKEITDLQNPNQKGQSRISLDPGSYSIGSIFEVVVLTKKDNTWHSNVIFTQNIPVYISVENNQETDKYVNTHITKGVNSLLAYFRNNIIEQIDTFFKPTQLWPEYIYESLFGVNYIPVQKGISTKAVSPDDLAKALGNGTTTTDLSQPAKLFAAAYQWSLANGFKAGYPNFLEDNGQYTIVVFDKTSEVQLLSPTTAELKSKATWATDNSFSDPQAMFAMVSSWSGNYKIPNTNITLNSGIPVFLPGQQTGTHLVIGMPSSIGVTYRNGYRSILAREFSPNISTKDLSDFSTLMKAINLQASTLTQIPTTGNYIGGFPNGYVGGNKGRGKIGA